MAQAYQESGVVIQDQYGRVRITPGNPALEAALKGLGILLDNYSPDAIRYNQRSFSFIYPYSGEKITLIFGKEKSRGIRAIPGEAV